MVEGGEGKAWGGVGKSGGAGWRFRRETSHRAWLSGGSRGKSTEITAKVQKHQSWALGAGLGTRLRLWRHPGAKFKEPLTVQVM